MVRRFLTICLIFLLGTIPAFSKVYYVSTTGMDSNPGTLKNPLASIRRAQELVLPGDTVYIRGGTYTITESDISRVHQNLFACIYFIDKSGSPGARINYWAFPGETPVFDFTEVTPANQRVVGFYVTADYVHFRGLEMTGVQVTITEHTESYCVYSWGNHNVFERLNMHDNQGTGLRHRKGGDNLFLNCDALRNHDYTSKDGRGSNTDGFGCHPHDGGTGNVFQGCRAGFNSDDGYDVLGAAEAVVFENCWAFYNGYSVGFQSLGDGNGFKAGGYGSTAVKDLPVPIPSHTVRFCLAVRNKASGFYANHHIAGNTWYHNTAYLNKYNFNMLNRLTDNVTDVPGYDHILRNNLSYKGNYSIVNVDIAACDISHNSFVPDAPDPVITDADFLSLDQALLFAPRNPDGSLPEHDFMRLAPGGTPIDLGTDLGYTYYGAAPDLGAWEQDYLPFPEANATWYQYYYPDYYWEPGRQPRYRIHGLMDQDTLVGDHLYHKLFSFRDAALDPSEATCVGGIRETADKKVYFRNFGETDYPVPDTGEVLLYDFGVRAADTIRNGLFTGTDHLIVSGFDAVSVNGQLRKRILFENFSYTKWIMGMGSERGLLFPSGDQPTNGMWGDLVCFFQGGEKVFHNDSYQNCYEPSSGTDDLRVEQPGITIFPNPCPEDRVSIRFPGSVQELLLVNPTGQILKMIACAGETTMQIEVSDLDPGMYFIRANARDGKIYMSKLIISR